MANFSNYTLSYAPTAYIKNGSELQNLDSLSVLETLSAGKEKKDLPITYCYTSTKGNFNGSNVFQFDIDTDKVTGSFFEHWDDICTMMPSIVFAQPSASGKLHVVSVATETYTNECQYYNEYLVNFACLLRVIEVTTGIDVSTIDKAVDLHNANPMQGLFFSSQTAYENDAEPIMITHDDREKLIRKYGLELLSKQQDDDTTAGFRGNFICTNRKKIRVDRNFKILNRTGYDVRLQWSIVVMWYCHNNKEEAKKIYKQLFLNPEDFVFPDKYIPNSNFKNAFDVTFGVIETDKEPIEHTPSSEVAGTLIDDGKWLSDYKDFIINAINTDHRLHIIAPTGAGKTQLMNQIGSEKLCIIVTPYNSQLLLYSKIPQPPIPVPSYPFILGQPYPEPTAEEIAAREFANSPFNVVISGHAHILQEGSLQQNGTHFDETKTNICIWDQFVTLAEVTLNTYFKDHIIFIDESQLLFTDRNYRETAGKLIDLINNFEGKVVMMTATPTLEHKLIRTNRTLEFYRKRKDVNVLWIDTVNPYKMMTKLVAISQNKNKKTVVFSDPHSKVLYENCIAYKKYKIEEITMIHASFLRAPFNNAMEVMRNEILDRKLTICTKFAYAGINFKNNEPIDIVIEASSTTDYAYIQQAIGRIRNADVVVYVVHDTINHTKNSAEERECAVKELVKNKKNEIVNALFSNNDEGYRNWDAEKELEQYYKTESQKEVVIKKLCESGYIRVWDCGTDKNVGRRRLKNEYKRLESEYLINEIIQNQKIPSYYSYDCNRSSYVQDWLKKLNWLEGIDSISEESIINYIDIRKKNSTIQIDAMIRELEEVMEVCDLPIETQNKLRDSYLEYVAEIGLNSMLAKKVVARQCKRYSELLRKFEFDDKRDSINMDIEELIEHWYDDLEEQNIRIHEKRSACGKKGNTEGKAEGGRKGDRKRKAEGGRIGGETSSRRMSIELEYIGEEKDKPEGLDANNHVYFDNRFECCRYVGVSSATFCKFCNHDDGAWKLRKKWKIVEIIKDGKDGVDNDEIKK